MNYKKHDNIGKGDFIGGKVGRFKILIDSQNRVTTTFTIKKNSQLSRLKHVD